MVVRAAGHKPPAVRVVSRPIAGVRGGPRALTAGPGLPAALCIFEKWWFQAVRRRPRAIPDVRAWSYTLVLAIVVACTSAAPVTPVPSAEQPAPGGRLVLARAEDLTTLQPVLHNSSPTGEIIRLLYAPLLEPDPHTGELKPNLGSWSISPDGLVYSWTIAAEANWSDGTPIVADDWLTYLRGVARSKKTVRKPNFQEIVGFTDYAEGRATTIAGVRTDGKRMTVTFKTVLCPALAAAFGFPAVPLPSHVFGRYLADADAGRNLDDAPENLAPPVSSGPFVLDEWRKGESVLLARNPRHWKGAPLLESVTVRVVANVDRVIEELRSGQAHFDRNIPPTRVAELEREPRLRLLKHQDNGYTYLGWNLRRAETNGLGDRRLRQALAYGLDTDLVIRDILLGHGIKMVAHHPPPSWASPSGLNEYRYDPVRAEELIRAAGYAKGADGFYGRDGRTLALTAVTNTPNTERERFLQLAADQYRLIGVKLELKRETFAALVDKLATGSWTEDAVVIGWSLSVDADPYEIWHSSRVPDSSRPASFNNFVGLRHPALDTALERGRFGPDCSRGARRIAYETVNRILNEEQPYNFGFSRLVLVAVAAALQGVDVGPFAAQGAGQMHNIEKWWFKN